MEEWKKLISQTITEPEEIAKAFSLDINIVKSIHKKYPIRINPYYLSLIKEKGDPIWKQVVPDILELSDVGYRDPLSEDTNCPALHVTHRYPDRVLFYVTSICSTYCRFCSRKRKVGSQKPVLEHEIGPGIDYIKGNKKIRDVVISGGDPLMMSDEFIDSLLSKIRAIKHVEIIRIGTRIPVTLPQRITKNLCSILKKYHPLYINTHFNHPCEITPESKQACEMLADIGIPLGNQSVLLKGVNDRPEIMKKLVQKLLSIRVKPYYIYQMDLVKGTNHFRTSIDTGLDIIKALRGYTSGLAVPHYVVDTPNGGGKISIKPNSIIGTNSEETILKNYQGKLYSYPNPNPKPKQTHKLTTLSSVK